MAKVRVVEARKCVEREIIMRRNVYRTRVKSQRMTAEKAALEILQMRAVLAVLKRLPPGDVIEVDDEAQSF